MNIPTMTESIWKRRLEAERARREKIHDAMKDYDDDVYYPAMRALRDECANSGDGHKWEFSCLGPLGDPWFHCNLCGASECRRDR